MICNFTLNVASVSLSHVIDVSFVLLLQVWRHDRGSKWSGHSRDEPLCLGADAEGAEESGGPHGGVVARQPGIAGTDYLIALDIVNGYVGQILDQKRLWSHRSVLEWT